MTDERPRVRHKSGGRTLVKASEAHHTDINKLMERYNRTGTVPQRGENYTYGDYSTRMDFHEALSRVRQAEKEFMHLPAHIRKFCDNDPGRFVDLVHDADGRSQLEKLGMLDDFAPPGAPEPTPAPVEVPPDPSAGKVEPPAE